VSVPVAAVVLAGRGGSRLERTLGTVGWAAERIVLASGAGRDAGALPAGVTGEPLATDLANLSRQPWVLLLVEGELVEPPLAADVEAAVRAGGEVAYQVPLEVRGLGAVLHPGAAPIRLVPARGASLDLHPPLVPALATPARDRRRLPARLTIAGASTLAEAVTDLDADAGALAALLHAHRRPASIVGAVRAALGAAAPLAFARRTARAPWGRWRLVVTAGYRAIVAYAKAWELGRVQGT
jgi:hypothetical protein